MSHQVLVVSGGLLETECVVHALQEAGLDAGTGPDDAAVEVVVAVATGADGSRLGELARGRPLLVVGGDGDVARHRGLAAAATCVVAPDRPSRELADAVAGLLEGSSPAPPLPLSFAVLTQRELQILALLAQGRRNDQIARELGISYHTVRTHVAHVLTKLGAPHRHAAVALAHRESGRPRRAAG